jgi:radical SAM protein with 4Fe4S-binding SPASM domain
MATSINSYNWKEIDEFVEFGFRQGVRDISFLTIRPNNLPDPNFSVTDYRKVIDKLIYYKFKLKGKINIITHDPLIPLLGDLSSLSSVQRESIIGGNTCEAGRSFFSIAPDGTVRSCNLVELVVGNVLTDSVAEIFSRFAPEVYDEGSPTGCEGCKHSLWCRGGCKAFAILEEIHREQNFFVQDQRCIDNGLKEEVVT